MPIHHSSLNQDNLEYDDSLRELRGSVSRCLTQKELYSEFLLFFEITFHSSRIIRNRQAV